MKYLMLILSVLVFSVLTLTGCTGMAPAPDYDDPTAVKGDPFGRISISDDGDEVFGVATGAVGYDFDKPLYWGCYLGGYYIIITIPEELKPFIPNMVGTGCLGVSALIANHTYEEITVIDSFSGEIFQGWWNIPINIRQIIEIPVASPTTPIDTQDMQDIMSALTILLEAYDIDLVQCSCPYPCICVGADGGACVPAEQVPKTREPAFDESEPGDLSGFEELAPHD